MKIAILASNAKPIPSPPDLIFAPGVIIQELADGLIRRGHDVTLFAPEGTKTDAKLVTAGTKSLYEEFSQGKDFAEKRAANIESYLSLYAQYELLMAAIAFEYIKNNNFDIVHSHKTRHEIYFTPFINVPCAFTFHDPPEREVANKSDEMRLKKFAQSCYFISLSNAQRQGLEYLNWAGTVYSGVELNNFKFAAGGKNLLFVGRLTKAKGIDVAIEVAKDTDAPLTIVGDIAHNPEGLKLFDKLKSAIDNKKIKYLGHIHYSQMNQVYQNAKAILFPIISSEAFGLVMIEAMACGTPVVAFNRGAVPEVIEDGKTGFIVRPGDIDGMVKAVKKIYAMPETECRQMRRACREHVEKNFTVEKMVDGYEKVYEKVIEDYQKRKHEAKN